jgi:hypothetical protein
MRYEDLAGLFDIRTDDWTRYDNRMESLAKDIERSTGLNVILDKDLNYSSGYNIRLLLDDAGKSGTPGDPAYRYSLRFYVSSKSDLFCVRCIYNVHTNHWALLEDEAAVPEAVEAIRRSIVRLLHRHGYKEVVEALLKRQIPGRIDELGAPSTVFSALFSEMY